MEKGLKKRLFTNKLTTCLIVVLSALTAVPLFAILGQVFYKGIDQFSWSFFTETTPSVYRVMKAVEAGSPIPGGIANGIVGTVIMLFMSMVVAIPAGILGGAFLVENRKTAMAKVISYLTDLLQGTPSVIIGIVVYLWVVVPTKTYSAVAGSVALCIMMLPLIIRSTEETLKILPASLKESGLALGASRATVMFKIQLPAAFGGIFTGVLLAVSRVIGETAPLLFTALGCSLMRYTIDQPISAVPLLIWEFFNDPFLQEFIWGASLFLLFFVLTLNVLSKQIAKKWKVQS